VAQPDLRAQARQHAEALAARGALQEARRWADRLTRLAPADPNARFLLAMLCLQLRDRQCETLLAQLADTHDVREVWIGLAAVRRMHGDGAGAADAAQRGLSRHAIGPGLANLLPGLARAVGRPGWCGLSGEGRVLVGECASRPTLWLDDRPVAWGGDGESAVLAAGWRRARLLAVRQGGADLLGSPIDLQAIRRLEGFVAVTEAGLSGWAWHPADPDRPPELILRTASGDRALRPDDTAVTITGPCLLARPRGFTVPTEALRPDVGPVRVLDQDGRDLPGSPLHPGAEQRAAAALARCQAGDAATADLGWLPLPIVPGAAILRPAGPARRRAVAVVLVADCAIADATVEAARRVRATVGPEVSVILAPLRGQAPPPAGVTALPAPDPSGWAAAANAGLRRAAGCDVVLLDASVMVAAGWLEHLRSVCLAQDDIGSASPLAAATAATGEAAAGIAIPLAGEHLVYLRRDCLEQTGLLRAAVFPQGEGAVADLSLRAAALGWRHMAAPAVRMSRQAPPATAADAALAERNRAVLARLHPGLAAMLAAHPSAAALAVARRRVAAQAWLSSQSGSAGLVILVTHADGGGVERHIRARARLWRAAGQRPVVLRPAPREDGPGWCVLSEAPKQDQTPADDAPTDLRFRLPEELAELAALLRTARPELIELHHLLGHDHAVLDLARHLGIAYDIFIHDYAWFCPRILLVGRERRYCGEPDLAGCQACIADLGSCLEEEISVAALRQRSAADLAGARRVVAPSQDTANRLRRHFPAITPAFVAWEDEAPRGARPVPRAPLTRVCVVGAIGIEKGFELLLDCARDAASRRLKLEFVLVGHSIDDARLLDTGRVFVTGAYREAEAVALIAEQNATLGFIPSLWPETWCYTLSHIWAAGLRAAAFDIGAPAERIRRTGQGDVLPLGLQPEGVNQALLAYAAGRGHDLAPLRRARGRVKITSITNV
jgi:glycosyltransferase involved in cell wall biosynthesis